MIPAQTLPRRRRRCAIRRRRTAPARAARRRRPRRPIRWPTSISGKTVNVLIGVGVGGEYDIQARLVARHIGKHIPGHPTVVPQNMTGAGGLKMLNYLYSDRAARRHQHRHDPECLPGLAGGRHAGRAVRCRQDAVARHDRAGGRDHGGVAHDRRQDYRRCAQARDRRRRLGARRHHLHLSGDDERAARHQVQDRDRLHRRQPDQPGDGARRGGGAQQHLVELESHQGGVARGKEDRRHRPGRSARARSRCALDRAARPQSGGASVDRAGRVRHPAWPAARHQRRARGARGGAACRLCRHHEGSRLPRRGGQAGFRGQSGARRADAARGRKGAGHAQADCRAGEELCWNSGPRRPVVLAATQARCYLPAHDGQRHRQYSQFLHRRTYRPRQVHARRPADPAHRRSGGARDGRAGARFDGYRARARHHHQGADRPPQVQGARRQGLCAQPDRHARPCRLRLRGEPVARRLRGLAAGGGRKPGRRGADARQRLSRHRRRPRDRAGAQQGRPAGGRARTGAQADRGRDRDRCLERDPDLGQDRRERAGGAGGDRHPPAAAEGRPRGDAEGAAGRQLVRFLPRRRGAGADRRRHAQEGPAHPHDGHRRRLRGRPRRRVHAQAHAGRRARPGRDRLSHRLDQGGGRHPRRRHHHRRQEAGDRGAARLPARHPGGVLRPVPGRRRAVRGLARRHGQAPPQRRELLLRDGDLARRSASASAAASSGCCIWKSSRSGWSASSTST